MKIFIFLILLLLPMLVFVPGCVYDIPAQGSEGSTVPLTTESSDSSTAARDSEMAALPLASLTGTVSLEEVLSRRRSVREYSDELLSLKEISQLLWAGQGITAEWGGRTAPSAGGLYPLELYIVVKKADELTAGVYKYVPQSHTLSVIKQGDINQELTAAALEQEWVKNAPAVFIISGVFSRTTSKYGERGEQYVYMEAGHAAQNICLQAAALNIGTVTVGAFNDDGVARCVGMGVGETPLYIIPAGKMS
jgi:SagB-type dehydrogenase family enzyme